MSLGKLIKHNRIKLRFPQDQLASGICSTTYLSKIENEKVEANPEIINLLLERLNINPHQVKEQKAHDLFFETALFNWIDTLEARNTIKAKCYYYQFIELINGLKKNPVLFSTYLTVKFRYHCLIQDKSSATLCIKEINENKQIMNETILFYYYKALAIFYIQKSSYTRAKIALDQAHKYEEYGKAAWYGDYYYLSSLVLSRLGDSYKSNSLAYKSLTIFENQNLYSRCIDTKVLIGINSIRLGDFHEAEKIFLSLLKVDKNLISDKLMSFVNHNLGYVYMLEGKSEEAVSHLLNALKTKKEEKEKINTFYLLAKVYKKRGLMDLSNKFLIEGQRIATIYHDYKYLLKFKVFSYVTEIENQGDSTILLISTLNNEVVPYFEKNGEVDEYYFYLKLLGEQYYKSKQYKKASDCFERITNYSMKGRKNL